MKFYPGLLYAALMLITVSCNRRVEEKGPIVVKGNIQAGSEGIQPFGPLDQSPMDMSYFPPDYPLLKMNGTDTNSLLARVIYSRPQKKHRRIFGDSIPAIVLYGREWRLGANEASEIEFFRDVVIQGQRVPKNRYVIYCFPYPDKWSIVLNSNLHSWGLHMEPGHDQFRFDIPVEKQNPPAEYFTMLFDSTSTGARLLMAWDDVKAYLPVDTK